jgi:predicted phage terminase large subunit-like protein
MLCEKELPRERYEELKDTMDPGIFEANYHQKPIDIKGRLYSEFKEYEDIPRDKDGMPMFEAIIDYTDTADEGRDWLCSIAGGVYQGRGYILDVLFTPEPMELTEPQTADMLVDNNVDTALFESNNGGRGFARNVDQQIWERHHTRRVNVLWFHQTANKISRILSNSSFVLNNIYFPKGWKERWPKFYHALISYQKEGRNQHDDAPDALTGFAEMIADGIIADEPQVETYQSEVNISPV